MSKNTEDKISIYKLETPQEILSYYKKWSQNNDYEKDLNKWNYVAPFECCQLFFKENINKESYILDAGCGTGLVGKTLKEYNYNNLEGLDFSQEMLDLIPKNIYKKKYKVDLNQNLDIPNNYYDHALCVGTFTYGHVKSKAFEEFYRILKNESFFIFSINEGIYKNYKFDEAISTFEREGKWRVMSSEKKLYIEKKQIDAYYFKVKIIK